MSQAEETQGNRPESREAMMQAQDEEIKKRLKGFKNKILVLSGKGGVGKSTIAAYLSVGLARKGLGRADGCGLTWSEYPKVTWLKGEYSIIG